MLSTAPRHASITLLRPWIFFLALVALTHLGIAEARESRQFPATTIPVALSHLSDRLGWKQPMYYSTIQTADIDGDGQSEILARWIDGLHIYRFENGTLFRHSRIPALDDNAGFHEPSWHGTIRTAVLDRSFNQADVIVRQKEGIHVFRYDRVTRQWAEIGSRASMRPFADTAADGTDWTLPQHYSTIQLADLTGDGVPELVGRGRNGMQAWRWDRATESWTQLTTGGVLADADGFGVEPYYASAQLVDLDGDDVAELVARAPTGVRTYTWRSNVWVPVSDDGLFKDEPGRRYHSVQTFVDAAGRAWLYGVMVATRTGAGAIQVYQWTQRLWLLERTIPLPGSGWDRESQFSTLMAADIRGGGQPEFLIRGPRGLHAFTLSGDSLPRHSQSFTDAQGWNLAEHYRTLQTATAMLPGSTIGRASNASGASAVVIGRGKNGLEVYKFGSDWTAAAESNFPQYCTDISSDSSPQCQAYKAIGPSVDPNQNPPVVDIRSQYTQASNDPDTFSGWQMSLRNMTNPLEPANNSIWQAVQSEMLQELGYAETVAKWFKNYKGLLTQQYANTEGQLDQARDDVSMSDGDSVVAKWLEFTGDVTSAVAGFFEGGASISLIIEILNATYENLVGSTGDVEQEVSQIRVALNDQVNNWRVSLAAQKTIYYTDYSKLQQIGRDSATGGYDWANATDNQAAAAGRYAAKGVLVNIYRALLPTVWEVYWCDGNGQGGGADCGSIHTIDEYNCTYGPLDALGLLRTSNAYVYRSTTSTVNWDLMDRLTGPIDDDHPDNLNAIWYMMMLGGNLGWDLPQWGLKDQSPYVQTSDPKLAYDNIKQGYNGPGAADPACNGNGSTTGMASGNQTLSQRLSVAQHNPRHVAASEADGMLEEIRSLEQQARFVSPRPDVATDLTSPLQQAAKLIERAKLPTTPGREGSTSATTATHLAELFVRRVERWTPELGVTRAERLATQAYCLIAALQGQSQPGEGCL